ncbi:hypothetical protein ACIOC1_26345 [Streptomyces sp. NPDC088197]|uniref:hypothetical protein n=1 Tax=Streptomyces sp. NPDC088197 TaxID=3365840 RepID=UPI0038049CF2
MVRTQAPPPPGAVGAPGPAQTGNNGQTGKADPAAVARILAAQPGTRSYLDTALGLAVFEALGMAPRQTVAMVLTSAGSVGAVAGLAGVPLGIALHGHVPPIMGEAAGTGIPHADLAVYHAPQIALLAVAGLAIAAGGALLPASWAARKRTAVALRTE